ncbi:MAG: GNAT family N-acetyltransferase [Rubrivivax sp.]|jgi:putative acetyltransferase
MISFSPERPDQPEVVALLDQLDAYLATLYAPEDNHILDVQALLSPEVCFLVGRRAGVAVATGAFRRMPGEADTAGQAYAEIKRMFVLPSERGQRIAEQLLAALEAQARHEGLRLATLETGADQTAAVRLYERCGYALRGPFGGYPDNGLSLFMAKAL